MKGGGPHWDMWWEGRMGVLTHSNSMEKLLQELGCQAESLGEKGMQNAEQKAEPEASTG